MSIFIIFCVLKRSFPMTLKKASLAFIFTLKYFIYLTLDQLSKKIAAKHCDYFLIHQFKYVFCVLKDQSLYCLLT